MLQKAIKKPSPYDGVMKDLTRRIETNQIISGWEIVKGNTSNISIEPPSGTGYFTIHLDRDMSSLCFSEINLFEKQVAESILDAMEDMVKESTVLESTAIVHGSSYWISHVAEERGYKHRFGMLKVYRDA